MTASLVASDRSDRSAGCDAPEAVRRHETALQGEARLVRLETTLAHLDDALRETRHEMRELRAANDALRERQARLETRLRFMPSKLFLVVGLTLVFVLVAVVVDQQKGSFNGRASSSFGIRI